MIVVKQNNGMVAYGPNMVLNGLVLYLDAANINSYPGSGTAWNNLFTGYNSSLLLPAYNTLNYGNMSFNGINNYLSINNSLQVNTQTGFTIDMVINVNQAQTTYSNFWSYFFSDGNIEIGTYYTSQGVNNSFAFKDNGTASGPQITSGAIAGSWYNITIGCNNTIPFMYKNGVLVATASAFRNATWSIDKLFLRQTDLTRNYAANLGLIRVYNKALSASEVYQNYLATKSRYSLNDNFWNVYKRNVASIYDAVVNPDGELIWNSLPANMASNFSLQIMPYAMRAGQIIAGDNYGATYSLTHTRGTLATFVDKDGYIKYGAHNRASWSEDFTQGKGSSSLFPIVFLPGEKYPAYKLIPLTASAEHSCNPVTDAPITYVGIEVLSVYAKAYGYNYLYLRTNINSSWLASQFNLANGTITSANASFINTSIEDMGSGWYKCSIAFRNRTIISAFQIHVSPSAGSPITWAGDGISGILVSRVQVTNGPSLLNYVKTTGAAAYLPRWTYDPYTADYLGWLTEPTAAINLLTYNSDYTNVWTRNNFSATTSTTLSPDGVNTAQILYNSNTQPQLIQNIGTPSTIGNYTITCFVKPISQQYIYLQAQSYTTVTNYSRISFDLTNVTATFSDVSGTGYTATASNIELYRDGWLRLSATFILPVDGSRVVLGFSKTYGAYTPLDSGVVNQIYLWGFQAETGDKASSLIPTYASQVTRNADNITIPTTAGQYFSSGSCYLEASTKRLNGVASRWLYMTTGSGNILYSSSDNAGNQVIVWDGVNAAAKSSTGFPTYNMSKMISSWGPSGLKITQNSLSVATSSFDGGMGLSNSTSITFGGDTVNSAVNTLIRACILSTSELPNANMLDWTNSSKFLYETPYKAFRSLTMSNIYFIPEGDSQFQRLTDYTRNNFSSILVAGAFSGNTIYALDNNGGTVSYLHTRGSLATQVNRNGLIEYCANNLVLNSILARSGGTIPTSWTQFTGPNYGGTLSSTASLYNTGVSASAYYFTANNQRSAIYTNFSIIAGVQYCASVKVENISGSPTLPYILNVYSGFGVDSYTFYLNGVQVPSSTVATTGTIGIVYSNTTSGTGALFMGYGAIGTPAFGTVSVNLSRPMFEIGIRRGLTTSLDVFLPTTTAAVYAPRYSYNPTTLTYEGWLFENAGINLVQNSNTWNIIQGGIVSTNSTIAPDGTLTGNLFTATISSPNNSLFSSCSTSTVANTLYTGSTFIKKSNASVVYIDLVNSGSYGGVNPAVFFNIDTQTLYNPSATAVTYSYQPYTNGWYRVSVTGLATGSVAASSIRLNLIAASDSVYIWGSQFEAATTPTSYIPTYGSQVTRNADTFAAAASNNMLNLGTLYVNMKTSKVVPSSTGHQPMYMGGSNYSPFYTNVTATSLQSYSLGSSALFTNNTFLDNTFNKLSLTWGNNTWQHAGRGITGSPGSFVAPFGNGVLSLSFGSLYNIQSINILTIANIPLKLNDSDLRNLTV